MLALLMTFVGDDPARQEKFLKLYNKYRDNVFIRALKYMGNEDDAWDVVQETFIIVARDFDMIGDIGSKSTKHLLLTIVGNKAKDEIKRRTRRKKAEEAAMKVWNQAYSDIRTSDRSAKYEAMDLVNSLPEIYRRPLFMYYINEMKIENIAELMGISQAAVRKRIERGRVMLRERIGDVV